MHQRDGERRQERRIHRRGTEAEVERRLGIDRRAAMSRDPSDDAIAGRALEPANHPRMLPGGIASDHGVVGLVRHEETHGGAGEDLLEHHPAQGADVRQAGFAAKRACQARDAEYLFRRVRFGCGWLRVPGWHDAFARTCAADGSCCRMHGRFRRHQALVRGDERIHDRRVVHRPAAFEQDGDRGLVRHPRAVGTIGRQRIEAIDDRQDPGADGDVGAADPIGVAGAVPVLMVMADDRHHRIGEVDGAEDLGADRRVQLHLLEFGRRELARLVEDVLGHGNLSRVVQQRAGFDGLERVLVGHADFTCEADRGKLHAPDMAVRHFVLGVDGRRQGLDRRQIHAVEFLDVALGVLEPPERRAHRQVRDDRGLAG